ncbi:hypothetical protein A2645_01870 [Candidatus Nomurabacteria bacterium RIFCSPHIGHO2_01_FULL_39_9]|uniref:Uncharacterized protein n=1 Tax=Candidatus Nomurabacteria bacterium RIFCSPHIGHO2_01_FULL_39_9 TaxID=1801735 RepID=A0A1F6UXB6_9BACT|nr:MAG: hypothetical protein A2645_01870 [Candidatus Nomurabacteria bacterium RIFCSPHIGHO2_01_FULL_39_9]
MTLIKKLNIRIFLGIFLAVFCLYLYLVSSITLNIIERKNIENEMKNKASLLSGLELDFLAQDRKINPELAKSLGFEENNRTFFAYRKTLVASLE